jgi:ferredoxin
MTGIVMTLGPRDRITGDGPALVAERAGLAADRVRCVEGLAERALERDRTGLARLFLEEDDYVVGCTRPRAVRALLDFAGVEHRAKRITWVTLAFDREALKREYGVPWYPVIDRSRCSGCGTCLEYCLFSVYSLAAAGMAGERVRVTAPLNCKTGCPACARLCPEGALIFPFCSDAELNGEVEEPLHRTRDALTAALGDDPMRVLAERRQRKRLIDPENFSQAEKERILYSGVL